MRVDDMRKRMHCPSCAADPWYVRALGRVLNVLADLGLFVERIPRPRNRHERRARQAVVRKARRILARDTGDRT